MTRKTKTTKTASVVPEKYRERYDDGSCGDNLAVRLKKHATAADGTTDIAKLRALAQRNDVWSASYAKLNAGLARMTIEPATAAKSCGSKRHASEVDRQEAG
jgi:hypothetical protein